jgi:hypothetical protein
MDPFADDNLTGLHAQKPTWEPFVKRLPIHAGSCDPHDIAVANCHRHSMAIIVATISSRASTAAIRQPLPAMWSSAAGALRDAAIHAPIAIAGNNVSPVQARRSLCRGAINQSHRGIENAAAYDA